MTRAESRRQLARTFDRHGPDLHAVATLLTPDPELARRLVVLALADSEPTDELPDLSTVVVRGWIDGHPEQVETITPAQPSIVDRVHELSAHERASLALCRFGGQTYREAATTLDLRPSEVATLLTSGLRSLRVAPPAPGLHPEERAG